MTLIALCKRHVLIGRLKNRIELVLAENAFRHKIYKDSQIVLIDFDTK